MLSLEVESRTVARALSAQGFGFDPTPIISIAFAVWQECLQKREPAANPAEYLRARFADGKFYPKLLDDARPGARKATRVAFRRGESPKRRLSDEELDQVSTAAFQHVMDADDDVLAQCGAEAFGMSMSLDDDVAE